MRFPLLSAFSILLAGWVLSCVLSKEQSGRRGMPEPELLAQGVAQAHSLVLDQGEFFWADGEGVKQMKPGGPVVTRWQGAGVGGLAVTADAIYWATENVIPSSTGPRVMMASRSGGDPWPVYSGEGRAYAITANGSGVFFLHTLKLKNDASGEPNVARVVGVLTDGTVTEYTGDMVNARALATDGTTLFLASGGPWFPGVEDSPPGRIDACPISGCNSAPYTIAAGYERAPSCLTVRGGWIYSATWRVHRVPVSGGTRERLMNRTCADMKVDDLGIYCAGEGADIDAYDAVVQRLWESDYDAVLVDMAGVPVSSIATDDAYVYFATGAGGVYRAQRWSGATPYQWMGAVTPELTTGTGASR